MATRVLNGKTSWLECEELNDQADIDFRRSMVDGADEPKRKSNASNPTRSLPLLKKNITY